MKKILTVLSAVIFGTAVASAQVLSSQQMKNTAWIGFGAPIDGSATFYGFTDTFQARFDRGNFTIEGMLNWSFLANYDNEGDVDNFVFGTSNGNPLSLKYGTRGSSSYHAGDKTLSTDAYAVGTATGTILNNQANVSNTIQDSYYVNFIWHPKKNFDIGVGTKLNWQVGPAPRYGNWLWESDAHVRQGGFSTSYDDRSGSAFQTSSEATGSYKFNVDKPGSADVVGFIPYANKYAKRALGVRYNYNSKDLKFQIGAAIPNGFNTDDPAVNLGIQVAPVNWLSIAATLEGAFEEKANFYSGATIGAKNFILDLYIAADSLFSDADDDEAYGLGAAINFIIPNTKINLRPEIGLNFFENSHYDFAWYTGAELSFAINNKTGFNLWGSWAQGSKDDRWADYKVSKDWNGGHVLNLRPELTYDFSKNTTFAVYADFEQRTAFDGENRKCWSSGVFMTYIF